MPKVTRLFAKSALVYLVLGLALGVAAELNPTAAWPLAGGVLRPLYVHFLTVGWISQLIFGVAHWMFPRGPRGGSRGSEHLAIGVYLLLNSGLALRAVAEPAQALGPTRWSAWLLAVSALAQWLAGLMFVVAIWGRVRGK